MRRTPARRLFTVSAIALLMAIVTLPSATVRAATTAYVATTGSDSTGNGSAAAPWATITHAVNQVGDGSTILVRAGTYTGRVRLDRVFAQGITIRSETPYQARLRHNAAVVTAYYGEGITLEGFDIAHSGPGAGALIIQIQDLRGPPGGAETVRRITLRNNVLHDSYNNDILKINNGATNITVIGNIFYNQTGHDEHIDVNSVTDVVVRNNVVVVRNNVFFNDFAGSGRPNTNDTGAFIVIKDSNGDSDGLLGAQRVTVDGNVFLNWSGSTGSAFVQVGEDATANYEARSVTVENNLMLGNSANTMRSPFAVMGSRDVAFRNNTVVGNFPSLAFAMRLYKVGANQPNENIRMFNNIWSDPTGTMEDFSDTPPGQTATWRLERNLYWNGGAALPFDAGELVNTTNDPGRIVADPRLPSQAGIVVPRWDAATGRFADGATSSRAAFEKLVRSYGVPAAGSPVLNAALAGEASRRDILGRRRTTPDIGAYETP